MLLKQTLKLLYPRLLAHFPNNITT